MKIKKIKVCLLAFGFSLFLTIPNISASPLKLKVTAELAIARVKPDISSPVICQIPHGTILESLSKEGEWYLVKLGPNELGLESGYVHESLVMALEPIPAVIEKKEKEAKMEPEKIFIPPVAQAPSPKRPREALFSLSLQGGGNYVFGGDLNKGAEGLARFYSDDLGIEAKDKVAPLHLSYLFGGEISLSLFPQFLVGFGGDYFLGKKESLLQYEKGPFLASFSTRPKIQAIPVRFFVCYYPLRFLYLKSGIEYYFAESSYFYRFEKEKSWQEWEGKAKAQSIGAQGGAGIEWRMAGLALFMEASGRFAKIKGFEGKDTFRSSEGLAHTEEGKLYFYEAKISGQKTYSLLFIREKKPSEAGVTSPREAEIDFSGLTIRAGIKIKF